MQLFFFFLGANQVPTSLLRGRLWEEENINRCSLIQRVKKIPRQIYSGVKLAYTIFTPQVKASHARTAPLAQNKPLSILPGVNFAYAASTQILHSQ